MGAGNTEKEISGEYLCNTPGGR